MWSQIVIDASNFTPSLTDLFTSLGWYGIPMDGGEFLYSPIGQ